MRRKHRDGPAHAAPRAPRPRRVVPILLGMLMLMLAAVAATALLMPELLVDLVPPPLDVRTAGLAAAGAAVLTLPLLVLTVVRGRRRTAELEFSRPQLATVAALTPEEEAEARQTDETTPLLPEPPSLAPPADAASVPPEPVAAPVAASPEGSAVATETAPVSRPRGSGVHVFEANRPAPGNGHSPGNGDAPVPARSEPAPQASDRPQGPFGWEPRHTQDGGLLVAEAWSFGPGKGRRRR
jgi:hypothetical protein